MHFAKQTIPIMGYITICFLNTNAFLLASPIDNARCPVEPTEIAISKYQTNYKDKIIYFCCKDCVSIFKENPKPYLVALDDLAKIQINQNHKSALKKVFDSTWNTGFAYPGISLFLITFTGILLLRFTPLRNSHFSFINKASRIFSSTKTLHLLLLTCLALEVCHSHISHTIATKDRKLENELHSTTFLEYGEPLIPSLSKTAPSLQSTFYRGNDERNPNLYNGGNYRTAEFNINLCTQDDRPVNYDTQVSAEDLFLRVLIKRSPNTAEYFWKKERMNEIYVTKNSGKFHWTKDKIIDSVKLNEIEHENSWEFRYPLMSFHTENHIKGIIYLCEKRKSNDGSLIGGRFHYAFQFNLKINKGTLTPESDLWMGPLYRKRSLRIWEIPEEEWLSHKPIPENKSKKIIKDTALLGIKDYEENRN